MAKVITFTELIEESDLVCPISGERDCSECAEIDTCTGVDRDIEDV